MIIKNISSRTCNIGTNIILMPLLIALVGANIEYVSPVWSHFKRKFIDLMEKIKKSIYNKNL